MSKEMTRTQDLLNRLAAGHPLVKCHGVGWTIGPNATLVPDVLVRGIQGSAFRLTLAGDGLLGIGSSQTMRLERIPASADLLDSLRRAIQAAGSLGQFSRSHSVSKGMIGNVESCTHDMTPGVAALLGFERITHLWRPLRSRGAA